MNPSESVHPCPNCGEAVFGSAQQCRHCGRTFIGRTATTQPRPAAMPIEPMPKAMPVAMRSTELGRWPERGEIHGRRLWVAVLLSLLLPGLGHLYMGYRPRHLVWCIAAAVALGFAAPPPISIIVRIAAIVSLKKRHGQPRSHRHDRFDGGRHRMRWESAMVERQMQPIHIHVHTDRG